MITSDGFPNIWDLAEGPNPELLQDYLRWTMDDPDRHQAAVNSMQWLPVGFSALTIAAKKDETGEVDEILQLNFYHPDYPGNEHPHGHSRWARTSWYASPDSRQRITRHMVLPEGAPLISELPLIERQVVANSIVDKRDGRRPDYNPLQLGSRLILEQSETRVAPLGSQDFGSLEVHNISFDGSKVAISAHYKRAKEPAALSGFDGLVAYKGLTPEQAEQVLATRQELAGSLSADSTEGPRLGRVTMIYPGLDFDPVDMEDRPTTTSPAVAEQLLSGGLATVEDLARRAG